MSTLKNKVQLIGRLGQDPEIINLESGKKLSRFSIAVNSGYTDQKGNRVEKTDWFTITNWDKKADFTEKYLYKGKEIAVEGKLSTRTYETATGEKRYTMEIISDEILLLSDPKNS